MHELKCSKSVNDAVIEKLQNAVTKANISYGNIIHNLRNGLVGEGAVRDNSINSGTSSEDDASDSSGEETDKGSVGSKRSKPTVSLTPTDTTVG